MLSPELQNLFDLCYFGDLSNNSGLIPCGWSLLDSNNSLPTLSSRARPSADLSSGLLSRPSSSGSGSGSGSGSSNYNSGSSSTANSQSSGGGDESEGEATKLPGGRTRMEDESSDDDEGVAAPPPIQVWEVDWPSS